jgi:hypothetical protein
MRTLLLWLLLLLGVSTWAQNSTQGKEFWFSFMENGYKVNGWDDWVKTQVMVSAKRACSGTIVNPRTLWQTTFTVGNESTVMIDIPISAGYHDVGANLVSDLGLKLTVNDTVSVYITNFATNSFDASYVLPIESLGSKYIVQCDEQSQSHQHVPDKETSAFLVVAVEDDTQVEVTPTVETLDGHQAGQPFTVTLNAGQTLSVRSNYITSKRDLSGTSVVAKDGEKIALFNGNTLTCVPGDMGLGHDHIFEQAIPVDTWGRQFAVTGSVGRRRDRVKVTSAADNDSVWCNGAYLITLNSGQSYSFWLYASGDQWPIGSCFVETSQPSHVCLYNTTSYDDESTEERKGDPSVVWIPPIEQRINEITFCTFHHYQAPISEHYVNIVVDRSSIGMVHLDGSLIDPAAFHPINGNNDYYFTRREISHGNHHLACPWGVVAHVYGFGPDKGYAYCAGSNLLSMNAILFVNGVLGSSYHNGLNMCVGGEAVFELKTNYELHQVHWDFDDGQSAEGASANHVFMQVGDFAVKALIEGVNTYSQEIFRDTLTFPVYVRNADYHNDTMQLCNVSSFEYHGMVYTESGYYVMEGEDGNGCYGYYLTLDMDFTPDFEIEGSHFPIGGSETYISMNEYAIGLKEERASIDTVLWQVSCPDWIISSHGKGERCTLTIYSFLEDTVMLQATVVNRCDTIRESFPIKTTYFDVDEHADNEDFEVSPNPTDGQITLGFGSLKDLAEISLYNGQGQLVDCFRVDAGAVKKMGYTLPKVSSGIYYLVLKNKGATLTRKVAVVR